MKLGRAVCVCGGLVALAVGTSLAGQVILPGTWYDQDKYHLATEPTGGTSWYTNYGSRSNGTSHDPGEPVSETKTGVYRIKLDDLSCWSASASNLVRYRTGVSRYQSWAYDDGISGTFTNPWGSLAAKTYTFDEGGLQNYCLEHENQDWVVLAQDSTSFSWVDPLEFIVAFLKEGSPVGIGIWADWSYGHALTVYAADTDTHTLTIADSDEDRGGQDYISYAYSVAGSDLTISYPTSQDNVRYLCAFDDVAWWTGGTGGWGEAAKWASRHAPTGSQAVYLTQSNAGTITVTTQAEANSLTVSGPATLRLSGGSLDVTGECRNDGVIQIDAGSSLSAGATYVGCEGAGALNITASGANIAVSNLLHFGADSSFTAVPGSTIHMSGAALENENADPNALAGLANLTLVFEGGPGVVDPVEVAGKDLGRDPNGWISSFALATLQLGGDANSGKIQLVDNYDNQPGWDGHEALYVENLVINAGGSIALDGLRLYFRNSGGPKELYLGDVDLDGGVDLDDLTILGAFYNTGGGMEWAKGDFDGDGDVDLDDLTILGTFYSLTPEVPGGAASIPEPAALAMVGVGTGILLRRRRGPISPRGRRMQSGSAAACRRLGRSAGLEERLHLGLEQCDEREDAEDRPERAKRAGQRCDHDTKDAFPSPAEARPRRQQQAGEGPSQHHEGCPEDHEHPSHEGRDAVGPAETTRLREQEHAHADVDERHAGKKPDDASQDIVEDPQQIQVLQVLAERLDRRGHNGRRGLRVHVGIPFRHGGAR